MVVTIAVFVAIFSVMQCYVYYLVKLFNHSNFIWVVTMKIHCWIFSNGHLLTAHSIHKDIVLILQKIIGLFHIIEKTYPGECIPSFMAENIILPKIWISNANWYFCRNSSSVLSQAMVQGYRSAYTTSSLCLYSEIQRDHYGTHVFWEDIPDNDLDPSSFFQYLLHHVNEDQSPPNIFFILEWLLIIKELESAYCTLFCTHLN